MEFPVSTDSAVTPSPTEAELLSLAGDQYMHPLQLVTFQKWRRQMRTTCLRDLDSLLPGLAATSGVADLADRASLEEEQAILLRLRHRESNLLNRIKAALHCIEAGTYGFCDDTGEPIGLPRLLARPTARLTIEARKQRDLRKNAYKS